MQLFKNQSRSRNISASSVYARYLIGLSHVTPKHHHLTRTFTYAFRHHVIEPCFVIEDQDEQKNMTKIKKHFTYEISEDGKVLYF